MWGRVLYSFMEYIVAYKTFLLMYKFIISCLNLSFYGPRYLANLNLFSIYSGDGLRNLKQWLYFLGRGGYPILLTLNTINGQKIWEQFLCAIQIAWFDVKSSYFLYHSMFYKGFSNIIWRISCSELRGLYKNKNRESKFEFFDIWCTPPSPFFTTLFDVLGKI